MASPRKVPVVVTTKHKGVFFGYGTPSQEQTIRIERARMCVYWSADVQGVLGLAATGPSKGCKISPEIPAITLQDVTSVMEASKESAAAWSTGPWAR